MYFDFEDYRPDITPVGRAISWREGVLLSIILHLVTVILVLLMPKLPDTGVEAARLTAVRRPPPESQRFVFVQPRLDLRALKPPERGDASDKDRMARSVQRPPTPRNALPYSRGNSPERVEAERSEVARGHGPTPEPSTGAEAAREQPFAPPVSSRALTLPGAATAPQVAQNTPTNGASAHTPTEGGALGEALRNLQRYVQAEEFDNQQGGGGAFGPAIQFDTKGVEFGPWIRRFIAQIKHNWFIPYAAMSMKGHVVIQFFVHKDGSISELNVAGPCPVDAFNNAAFNALASSNPTQPLPAEYPAERAFFTVTFYYNETPPAQ